jgi:hypothetical protein
MDDHKPYYLTESEWSRVRVQRVSDVYDGAIGSLRARARELGYALAVHGSLARDIDLVAVPWVDEAVDAETLIAALREVVESVTGFAVLGPDGSTTKPHGRIGWTIHPHGRMYFDISVMPRCPTPPVSEALHG